MQSRPAEADERFSAEAVVVSVLEANNGLQTGVIVAEGNKLMVLPDKLCNDPLVIAKVSKAAAMHVGDKVVFSIKKRGERHMDHTVNIVDVFGSSDTAKAGADAYMLSNNLHVNFPDDVLYEAPKTSTSRTPTRCSADWISGESRFSPSTVRTPRT